MKLKGYIMVLTTVSNEKDAVNIAETLVKERLAACVQIVPIKSIYTWKGALETANEHLIIAKTLRIMYEDVEKRIKDIHPYEVPEIIAVPIEDGSEEYLRWVRDSVGED